MHKSTKWLLGMVVFTLLIPLIVPFLPQVTSRESSPTLHDIYKFLHIFGAVIFLGNIIVTGVWMFLAERTGKEEIIRFAAKVVNWADIFFTAPGVILVLSTGLLQAQHHDGLGNSWITVGLGLFSLSGVVWLGFLIPYQHKLVRLAEKEEEALSNEFFKLLHKWYFWGAVATVLPLISLFIMVYKPKLW